MQSAKNEFWKSLFKSKDVFNLEKYDKSQQNYHSIIIPMLYVKLAEHKQGDGKTDRLLVFDGTGKLESTEGILFWRTSSVKGENQTARESPSKPSS